MIVTNVSITQPFVRLADYAKKEDEQKEDECNEAVLSLSLKGEVR